MGKQRKGAAKAAKGKQNQKKEQKKERRAQANDEAKRQASKDAVDAIFEELHLENSLLVGRLYYFVPNARHDLHDANSRRGILDRIEGNIDDDANSTAVFVPMTPLDDSDAHRVTVPLGNVIRQRVAWTLRFGVGDAVVVYDEDADAYVEAKVEYLWPVWACPKTAFGKHRTDDLVLYQCRTMDLAQRVVLVSEDEDRSIQKLPSSFRFKTGDRVLVAAHRLFCQGNADRVLQWNWLPATITDTHILDQVRYACYECLLDDMTIPVYVRADSDAYIASATLSPRQRLFSAMEDPEYTKKDFELFVKWHGIDVKAFSDIVCAKVVENASYGGTSLISSSMLHSIRDANGDGVLHQIARSPSVDRFLEPAVQNRFLDWSELSYIVCDRGRGGRLWVENLVENPTATLHTFELALSPDFGLGCHTCTAYSDEKEMLQRLESVRIDAWNHRRFELARMIQYLLFTFPFYRALYVFTKRWGRDCECDHFIDQCEGVDRPVFVKWFVQMLFERLGEGGLHPDGVVYTIFCNVHPKGYSYIELLLEGLPSLANVTQHVHTPGFDRNEFLEHYDGDLAPEICTVSLIEAIAIYRPESVRDRGPTAKDRDHYFYILRLYCSEPKQKRGSLHDFLLERARPTDYFLRHRAALLEDDPSQEKRLRLLDVLIKRHGVSPPNPLKLIRWWQCGVMSWLVDGGTIDLSVKVRSLHSLLGENKLRFLGGRSIPLQMTVGEYLCFASIEYDDLLSLKWLASEKDIQVLSLICNGWGVVHAAASFGRAEIILWLEELEGFDTSSRQPVARTRGGDETKLPVHLALEGGHCFIADRLLVHVKEESDVFHQSLMQIAKTSKYESVREWGKNHHEPRKLAADVRTLVLLLQQQPPFLSKVETYILNSRCFDVRRWFDCGMWLGTECFREGSWPINKQYMDLLLECLRVADSAAGSLATALTVGSFRPNHTWDSSKDTLRHSSFLYGVDCDDSPVAPMAKEELRLEFQRMHDGAELEDLLSRAQSWTSEDFVWNEVRDPEVNDPIFKCMLRQARERLPPNAVSEIRDNLLKIDFLDEVRNRARFEVLHLFSRGLSTHLVEGVVAAFQESSNRLALERRMKAPDSMPALGLMRADGIFNAGVAIHAKYSSSSFRGTLLLDGMDELPLYLFLAMEDHVHLAKWLLSRPSNLSSRQELKMVHVAVVFGCQRVVEMLLSSTLNDVLRSNRTERIHAAMIGAAEAGSLSKLEEFYAFGGYSIPLDELVAKLSVERGSSYRLSDDGDDDGETSGEDFDELRVRILPAAQRIMSESISACAVNGYLMCPENADAGHEAVCRWLVVTGPATASTMLLAAYRILEWCYTSPKWVRLPMLLSFLKRDLGLDLFKSLKVVDAFTTLLIDRAYPKGKMHEAFSNELYNVAIQWMEQLVFYGVDIQNYETFNTELEAALQELRTQQIRSWEAFDIVKNGQSLNAIRCAVAEDPTLLTMRDRGGRRLPHVAAAYDRLDVVEWLVQDMGEGLSDLDNEGHDVLAISRACGCTPIIAWIERVRAEKVISLFLSRYIYRRLAIRRRQFLLSAITKLQAWSRRVFVAQKYRALIISRFESSSSFKHLWSMALDTVPCEGSPRDSIWFSLLERHADMKRSGEANSIQRLDEAVRTALGEDDDDDQWVNSTEVDGQSIDDGINDTDDEYKPFADFGPFLSNPLCLTDRVLLTSDVIKWCRQGDAKYVGYFVRRMEQLATGERSRVLAKRLKGCYKTTVFETYLEQKSGYRILWTVQTSGEVLVWYVVPHKKVSRFASLIDSSFGRSDRQLVDALPTLGVVTSGEDNWTTAPNPIMLDPLGNTPLKLFTVTSDRLPDLANASWTPPLRLTAEERVVVEATGTTLVLGRSGTGKTICLCNKMDFDRQLFSGDDSFSQLFVARSERLSRFVRRAVGDASNSCFTTFQDLVSTLERSLSSSSASILFLPSQRVDFALFKRDVYRNGKNWGGVDALVAWTNIRSFVKGSIEALASPGRILSFEDYVSVEKLGRKRCRLSPDHRPEVYRAFRAYRKYLEDTGRWDDCDRISCLLQRLQVKKDQDAVRFESLRYSKIYVDEVQDYTQAEILLFYYLSRPGDLFLCGDPAQSVVEGVEFRFDEIRSVAHFVAGADRRHLVPQKPMTVNVNFRSHSGILNVAAAVLSRMFSVFPDSATQLKEDRGLFVGPRPGVLYKADVQLLNDSLSSVLSGTTILVWDEHKLRCSQLLDEYRLLYGIREAKGLEFKSVVLFDFFAGIPNSLQKAWRDLLLGRESLDYASWFPEVEGQIKLLYTAITRSIDRLLFVESKPSVAGEAFCRWVTTTTTRAAFRSDEPLAIRQRVSDVESLQMTVDEWVLAGLENAEAADDSSDPETADSYVSKALHCFEHANHGPYATKARTHRASAQFRSRIERELSFENREEPAVELDGAELEASAARLLSQLFREGLWVEATKVCQLVLPHLPEYTQEQLRKHVVPKLPLLK